MAFPVTINGRTYTLADFEGTNYVDGFPDALEDFVTQAGDIYNSTSSSSVAIGTGSKTFTVADSGKPYQAGTPLRISDSAAPETNFMDCIVTSYSGTTLVVNSFGYAGSGTKTSWNVNIGGAKTVDGTLSIAQGGTGATTAAGAATNLGLGTGDSPTFAGLTVDTNTLYVDATNNRVGIGVTPAVPFQVKTNTTTNVGFFDYVGAATISGVTDAGGSAELRVAGQVVSFTGAGGGGSEHMRIDSSGTLSLNHNIREAIYSLTGTDISPVNGGIQYKTLTANTTFTESLSNGDSVILRLSGGATYTVTWPTMRWVTSGGDVAPTLGGSDVVVLWQEGSIVYGAYVGSYA